MAALTCSGCERPAVLSCVCAFPLPLLCEEHRLSHSADSHFPLPLNALRHVQNIETQVELNERVSKLRRLHSHANLYNDPQQQPTIDIRDLLMQFNKDVEDLKAKVKELKAESVRGEEVENERTLEGTADILSALIWGETCPENELGTWMNIGHALSLKTKFQYEESCRVLESHWKLVHSNKQVEVLVLSLILGEVMGLHIGRFEEALAILGESLQVADELYPKSEITLQLANMKSAILISFFISEGCLDFCNKTVLSFHDAPTSEVSFGTALYLYLTAYLSNEGKPEPEAEAIRKEWTLKTENSSNSLIEHIRLYQSALLKMMDKDLEAAGDLMKAAEELAKRDFPTSIYAALSMFTNYAIRDRRNALKDEADFSDDECLRVHFPASLLRAAILEPKAKFYHRMQDKNKELEVRFLMHQLLQRSPSGGPFTHNVNKIADIYFDNRQAALDIHESAYRILFERAFASPAFSHSQASLSYCYQSRNMPEKEFEMYVEIIRKLQATDPTHKLLSEVLVTLSEWREGTQKEKARQMCVELYQFLRESYPRCENYFSAVKTVGTMHKSLQQREKVEDIFVESVQIAKTFYKFKRYLYFIGTIERELQLSKFPEEKKAAILDQVYAFLVSNIDPDCLNTARIISGLFSNQPEKLLTIFLAVYRTLLASPTDPALGEYLIALTAFYHETKQLDKEIEVWLKVHQVLLDHVTCENFLSSVKGLAIYYWNQKQREKAIQFQVEMSRLLSAHPTSDNYKKILESLSYNCSIEDRQDIALEQYAEAYRTLQPATNPQHSWIVRPLCLLHYKMRSRDTAIQLAQECMNGLTVLTQEGRGHLALLRELLSSLSKHQQIVDMYMNAIQIYSENGCYSEIEFAMRQVLDYLNSNTKFETIEKLLEIIRGLVEIEQLKLLEALLVFLRNISMDEMWEKEKEAALRKRVLQQVLCRHTTGQSSQCSNGIIDLLRQIGGLYWQVHEKERAEACIFRAARSELSLSSYYPEVRKRCRLLYSGAQTIYF